MNLQPSYEYKFDEFFIVPNISAVSVCVKILVKFKFLTVTEYQLSIQQSK